MPSSSRRVCRPGLSAAALVWAAVSMVTAAGLHAASQDPPTVPATPPAPATWSEAISRYEARDPAGALQLVEGIAADDLLREGRRLADTWQATRTDDARRHLRAAAALGMELSIAQLNGPSGPGPYVDLAETSLRALDRTSDGDDAAAFAATWRVAQLQLLLFSSQLYEVERRAKRDDLRHLSPALQAEWHVARGIAFEAAARLSLGSSRVQQTPFGTAAMPRHVWIDRNQGQAREHFEAAVAADASHREAQLRLGRLLLETNQRADARPHLERATTARCREVICGLGWLFLGDWHMAAGAPESARRAYVLASSVLDVRQSALIGLLGATLQARPAVALEMTRQFDADAMLARVTAPDAWSRYLTGQPLGWPAVIEALRREAVR